MRQWTKSYLRNPFYWGALCTVPLTPPTRHSGKNEAHYPSHAFHTFRSTSNEEMSPLLYCPCLWIHNTNDDNFVESYAACVASEMDWFIPQTGWHGLYEGQRNSNGYFPESKNGEKPLGTGIAGDSRWVLVYNSFRWKSHLIKTVLSTLIG